MTKINRSKIIYVAALLIWVLGVQFKQDKPHAILDASATPGSMRQLVDNTCGGCHANPHIRPPGEYSLYNSNDARTRGVFAQQLGVDPHFVAAGADPTSAIIIQKPMQGSGMAHGGIKISSQTPVMQALINWVASGAPNGAAYLDRPTPSPALAYNTAAAGVGMGANDHLIVYSRRMHTKGGFKDFVNSTAGGNIYRMVFERNPATKAITIKEDVNLTNLPATDDAQNPTVSLDGTKVAFARKQPGQNWEIWEIGIDGSGLRRITQGAGHKKQPFYLPYMPDGSFARAGEGGIGYLSDAAGFRDEYNTTLSMSLYVCDTNGGNIRQIDFNPSHDAHPWMHSSGMLMFSRWEHNEHQRQNFFSMFQLTAADYDSAGASLFGAFGEHGRNMGNSLHDPSEVLDANYGVVDNLITPVTYGKMLARRSSRDSIGGSIVGPFYPRLQDGIEDANVIAAGDDAEMMMVEAADIVNLSSITYREPRSLLNDVYIVSVATLTSVEPIFDSFTNTTEYMVNYSSWTIRTFELTGSNTMFALRRIHPVGQPVNGSSVGLSCDEAVPVVIKPQPPMIAKPFDHSMNVGVFTSGDVTERQSDGQPRNFSASDVSVVRFVRALQLSQGTVDTGRDTDEGIATQIVGEAPIMSDGSWSAQVPANTPLQFQVLDNDRRVLVSHKPWVQVMPGETMRCVGCHAVHDQPASVQTLLARQGDDSILSANGIRQFHFHNDIQPIFNEKCISCHDSALTQGAAGYNPNRTGSRALTLTGRPLPGGETEAFQSLTGITLDEMSAGKQLVRSQNARGSELMWWITGLKLNDDPQTTYPSSPALVPHDSMLNEEEIEMISQWIDTGINYRVVDDHENSTLTALDTNVFENDVWPILQNQCLSCHQSGGQGEFAMDLDGDTEDADDMAEVVENRMAQVAMRLNYVIPEASLFLRKPLGEALGGMSHTGGQIFTGQDDPNYLTIFAWIAATNPQIASAPEPSDLLNVVNYPNPFRDVTTFVYRLTGAVVNKVEIKIYSRNGKKIRSYDGPTRTGGGSLGWNRIDWDGRDDNGKVVGNDVYFYVVKAEFGDGIKKTFRGKCVKVK